MGTEEASLVTNESDTISDLESKVIRQVEYYFGDYNLGRDKFLKYQLTQNDGWVSLETMVKFNRLKQITEDHAVIAAALKKSPNKLLEVSEEGTRIRRSLEKPLPALTEDSRADIDSRAVYAKGFKADSTLDELIEFFIKFGATESIQMRRFKTTNRKFKGSVFVTFKTAKEAKDFLEQKAVEYKGTALLKEMKKDYLKRKDIEFEERLKKGKEKKQKKIDNINKERNMETENDDKKTDDDATKAEEANDFTKGCLLKLTGFSEGTMREHIKEVLEPHGSVSYADFSKGEPEAVIRFESAVAAEVLEKASKEEDGVKKIEIRGMEAVAVVLEGDEEADYWKKIKDKSQRYKPKGGKRGGWQGGRGRGRSGRGFGKGRHNQGNKRRFRDDDDDNDTEKSSERGRPTKIIKTEDAKADNSEEKTTKVEE